MAETKQEYWTRLIAEQEASGMTARQFCRAKGIGEHSFYMWRKRFRTTEPVQFALLETRRKSEASASAQLELVLATGERLRIGSGVDAATLRLVLTAVRG